MNNHDTVKHTLDVISATTAFMSFLNLLTPLFGLIASIWTVLRIIEMVTGKTIFELLNPPKGDGSAERQ
jgi:hypothetical protein